MSLQVQNVPIVFQDGLSEKTNDKLVMHTQLAKAYDVIQRKTGKLQKRPGLVEVENARRPSGAFDSGRSLMSYKDELLLVDGDEFWAYSEEDEHWYQKGTITNAGIGVRPVIQNVHGKSDPDIAAANGYELHAWQDAANGVHASVLDTTSGNFVIFDSSLNANGYQPRCVALGDYLFVLYTDQGILRGRRVDTSNPSVFGSEFNIATDLQYNTSDSGQFDIIAYSSSVAAFVYRDNNSNVRFTFGYMLDTQAIGNGSNGYPAPVTHDFGASPTFESNMPQLLLQPTPGNIYCIFVRGALRSTIGIMSRNPTTLASVLAPTTNSGYGVGIFKMTGCFVSSTSIQLYVNHSGPKYDGTGFYSAGDSTVCIQKNTVSSSGTFGTASHFKIQSVLASKAWYDTSYGLALVAVTFCGRQVSGNTGQNTTFVVDSSGECLAKYFQGQSGYKTFINFPTFNKYGLLSNVIHHSATPRKYAFSLQVLSDFSPEPSNQIVPISGMGISVCELDFENPPDVSDIEFHDNLYFLAGFLWQYDGSQPVEHGFHIFPEFVASYTSLFSVGKTDGTGGSPEITTLTCQAGSRLKHGQYLQLYALASSRRFYVRMDGEALLDSASGYVDILSTYTPDEVAAAFAAAINPSSDFNATSLNNVVTITATVNGNATDSTIGSLGSGSIGAGTYGYVGVYEWADSKGNVYRSAPSPVLSVTLGSTVSNTLVVPTYQYTKKTGSVKAVLVIYRTTNLGNVFYRLSNVQKPVFNDPTKPYVYTYDDQADASIVTNPILYTTGGVIENIAPPMATGIGSFKNRLIVGGFKEDPYAWWFSKTVVQSEGVGFSDIFSRRVDALGGGITGFETLDNRLCIGQGKNHMVVTGQGPNDLDSGGDFTEPDFISKDLGMQKQVGLSYISGQTSGPEGALVKTSKGWYLIDRALGFTYVGAGIEDINDKNVTKAVYLTDDHLVKIVHSDGDVAVFDYYHRKWYRHRITNAISCTIWKNKFCVLTTLGQVGIEDDNTPTDFGTEVVPYVEIGWMQMSGIQGFQRTQRLAFLGEFPVGYTYRVKQKVDNKDTVVDSMDYTPVNVNEVQTIKFSAVPDTGTWTLNFDGQVTGSLAFNISAASLETALEALSNLTSVTVTGDFATGFVITFTGVDGGQEQPILVEASNTLTAAGIAVTTKIYQTTQGAEADTTGFEVHVSNQTNAATKFSIEQIESGAQMWSITGMSLEVGVKKGLQKFKGLAKVG